MRVLNTNDRIDKMYKNFDRIQERIEEINIHQKIEIKQIADLQRYLEMQKTIMKVIKRLES